MLEATVEELEARVEELEARVEELEARVEDLEGEIELEGARADFWEDNYSDDDDEREELEEFRSQLIEYAEAIDRLGARSVPVLG